jgi:hypothetical protein
MHPRSKLKNQTCGRGQCYDCKKYIRKNGSFYLNIIFMIRMNHNIWFKEKMPCLRNLLYVRMYCVEKRVYIIDPSHSNDGKFVMLNFFTK